MAYAIIKTGGKQYKVSQGDVIQVERLEGEPGAEAVFDQVLCHVNGGEAVVGTPLVAGAKVTGTVLAQKKAPKVVAFKFRRRKGYHRTRGHRRQITEVKIDQITL